MELVKQPKRRRTKTVGNRYNVSHTCCQDNSELRDSTMQRFKQRFLQPTPAWNSPTWRSLAACLLTCLVAGCWSGDSTTDTTKSDVATGQNSTNAITQVIAAYKASSQEFYRELQSASSAEERAKIAEQSPQPFEAAERIMEMLEKDPQAAGAVDGLVFVASAGIRKGLAVSAISTLLSDHFDDSRLESICLPISENADRAFAEATLRRLIAESPHEAVRGMATFCLAKRLDGDKADNAEVVQAYQLFLDNYSATEFARQGLVKQANVAIYRNTKLVIGQPAMEISGEDLDGVPFKLSDYRGKVVLLNFWGDWCPQCRAMYPHQRSLVQQLSDQPFAILGVNNDDDREEIRQIVNDKSLHWRSFWDGHGSISDAWRVTGWPTNYLIDADGKLRYKNLRGNALDVAIEKLLREIDVTVDIKPAYQ